MSTSLISAVEHERETWASKVSELVELTKPRIMSMVLVTVVVAAFIATKGHPSLVLLVHTIIGTALVAGSGSVLNQWIERDLDKRMDRTASRPIPSGKVSPTEAFLFGLILGLSGVAYLVLATNVSAACWAGLTWLLYVVVYTPLKQVTSWNTAVGAVPGALPVIIAWVGVGEALDWTAFGLFSILFIWQFPHFMAIAWLYRNQYRQAGYHMMSRNDSHGRKSGWVAIIGAFALVALTGILFRHNLFSISFAASLAIAFMQLGCALSFFKKTDDTSARRLLRASLIYLPLQLGIATVFYSTHF